MICLHEIVQPHRGPVRFCLHRGHSLCLVCGPNCGLTRALNNTSNKLIFDKYSNNSSARLWRTFSSYSERDRRYERFFLVPFSFSILISSGSNSFEYNLLSQKNDDDNNRLEWKLLAAPFWLACCLVNSMPTNERAAIGADTNADAAPKDSFLSATPTSGHVDLSKLGRA